MISVSNGWLNAQQEALLPETFLEVIYSATEPGAQQSARSSATNEISFSEAATLVSVFDRFPEKYATPEGFGLDGSYEYFDGTPVDPGYVTATMSTGDATFETNPVITITMSKVHTVLLPGITITWSEAFNEWATDFRVTAWANSVVVASTVVTGNTSPISKVFLDMEKYNRITIEILNWSIPHHRVKCEGVLLGIQNVYTKMDLMGFSHKQTADLLSAALPKNEITFRLRNEDKRWNPDNPTGVEQYLLSRQEVRVRYGMTVNGKTEWIEGGTFWLCGWNTPSNGLEASFTARDVLAFMDEEYTGPRSGTLYEIAIAAFEQAALPLQSNGEVRYVVDDVLKEYTTDFSDENTQAFTMAQVLQMAAHAGNCTLRQDRDGVMRVEPWKPAYAGYTISPWISYSYPEYTISKPLKAVAVGYGDDQDEILVETGVDIGEVLTTYNVFLRTEEDARRVGKHTGDMLLNRKVITGDYRADVRLDVLDNIVVTSKYASNVIAVTEVDYSTTGGTFRGRYTGRVVSVDLKPAVRLVGEFYSGEV